MDQAADDGMTPVIIACQNGNPEQLKELLDKGASASDADKTGKSALHYCADNLETQCAEMILHKDIDLLNSKDEQGFTPLHMAVIGGNAPLLRLLLKKDADINCLDNEHHTVAHWATVCGHLEVLEILLENGADVSRADSHEAYPIHYAAQMNGKENGHTDPKIGEKVLRKLVENGVPMDVLDKDGRQPLLWAASAGNSESCKLLVKAGADVNAIDKDGLSALHCAASRGHTKCIETLKNLGANVDLADKNNCTALFYAITLGNKECTKALLKFGSNPNHQDNRGRTPTHCAAIKGCVDTVKMLDKHGAQLWTASIREDCPIHEAAQGGFCDVVKYLLKWKNDPNAVNLPNKGGRTCLHIAAIVNNLPLCKLLIDNGADKNATMVHKDKTYTPYDAAVVKGNQETADYIKGKGGNSSSDLDKSGKRESKSAKSRRSVLTLESTPEEREKEEQAESDKKEDVILTPVASPSKGKKGKGDKDKGGKDKEAEKKDKESEKKGKDEQKSEGGEEEEDDAKDPGVKPLVAAGVGIKAKDKKGKEKETTDKKKTKGKAEEEKDSDKQKKESQSEEDEKDTVDKDKTVPLGKGGVGAKRKGKGEKEVKPETEDDEEQETTGDNKEEEGKKSRKSSEQDDEAARIAAAAAAATAVKVKRRDGKEAGKKDSRGDSGVEADSEQETSEEEGKKEEGKENTDQQKGKTGQTAGGRVHRKKRRTDTVEEEEEEEEEVEGAGKKDTAALAAAALQAEEDKKKKETEEQKKKKESEKLKEDKKKKDAEKIKEDERKKKEAAEKIKEDERKKKEAAEKLKEDERKKKEAAEKSKEEEKKRKAEEERKKKEAAEKLKEEEKKKKEIANKKGQRVATPQQGKKSGTDAEDHTHPPAAGAAGVGLAAGKRKKEVSEVQKEEVGIQTDRKQEKEKPQTIDTGIQTKKQHTKQSGSQTELSGDQVVSRESSPARQPKSRIRTASRDESEGEFEVPKDSPESEAEALKEAAARRSSSRAESETNREEKPQSRQRVLQSPSKVPTDGRISQGLLADSRKPSRQRTFERSDSPDLSSGDEIDEKDNVDAPPKSRRQRAQNRLQNRTRKLRNRQVTGVYDPDRLSKPVSVHKQIRDKKKLARERDSQLNGRLVEMDRADEINDLEHSILRTRRGGGRCVNSIQESVRRYQSERRMVRQLHQLKRAQIYTGPMHDVVLFSKLMDVYRNNAPHDADSTLDSQVLEDWEGYLRDQLQFVSHFYEDDRTGLRSATNTARTQPSRSAKSASSAKRSVDNRYADLRFKEEFEMAEREAMEDRMKEAAKKTDESLKSVHSKTSDSLNEAKKVNDQLQNDLRRDVTERLKSGNSSKKERQWLIQESMSDEAQSQAESLEKERREKYKEWHKKKNEELRRKLLKVYGPNQDYSDIKSSKTHSFKSSTPRIAYTSTPRPKSQITMTSGGMSQAQYGMDREITVQMTEYGMRRVKKDPDYPFANWTPKFDGSLRPRAGLVFVEPEVYSEALKEEQRMKKAYSIAARSSGNVTMDDERLLGPVSS